MQYPGCVAIDIYYQSGCCVCYPHCNGTSNSTAGTTRASRLSMLNMLFWNRIHMIMSSLPQSRTSSCYAEAYSVGVNFAPVVVNDIPFGDIYNPGNVSDVTFIPAQTPDSCNEACKFFSECHAWTWKTSGSSNQHCHYANYSNCCYFKASNGEVLQEYGCRGKQAVQSGYFIQICVSMHVGMRCRQPPAGPSHTTLPWSVGCHLQQKMQRALSSRMWILVEEA